MERCRLAPGAQGRRPAHGQGTGFHALRHYYASYLVSEGADIVSVSQALGHHTPAFTLAFTPT